MDKFKLREPTVARENRGREGGWWLMKRREGGYSGGAYGLPSANPNRPNPFPSLHAILETWDVDLGRAETDEYGVLVEILPRREETRTPPSSHGARGK